LEKKYDQIGIGYNDYRKPDPRITAAINREIGPAGRIVNIGAGAGSYEPVDRYLVAVEPSEIMIAQRPNNGASIVQGFAESLPFRDRTFDAGLAILTTHHWADISRGFEEAMRVIRKRFLIFTMFDLQEPFWLLDYFPEIETILMDLHPPIEELEKILGPVRVIPIPIPHDCTDGFLCAYWRRPYAYLDGGVRNSISTFSCLSEVQTGLQQLQGDLESGLWHEKYRDLLKKVSMDFGYRLVVWNRS